MKKLIYFNNNDLVRNFCGKDGLFLLKSAFVKNPRIYRNCIAVCYGMSNYGELLFAKNHGINYIYIDNCYFGNLNSYYTNSARKNFYRISFNQLNISKIINRPDNRLQEQLRFLKERYGVQNYINDFRTSGNKVIIVPPSGKVPLICNLDVNKWINKISKSINDLNPNLDIVIRNRERSRIDRFINTPIHNLFLDAYATVTHSSVAAVESLIFGVPSFVINRDTNIISSAAEPVSRLKIKFINDRLFPENRYEWLSSLAYGQFSREEIGNGKALRLVLGG